MEQLNKHCIFDIFILSNFFKCIFGDYAYYEIIGIIIMSTYPKISISCGARHTILSIGDVNYGWGHNGGGRLGLDHTTTQKSPIHIPVLLNARSIHCAHHTIKLIGQDEIRVYGKISGYVTFSRRHIYIQDPYEEAEKFHIQNIQTIACGSFFSVIITKEGEIYTWGNNSFGMLGIGHVEKEILPQKINLKNIIGADCGELHTVAINKLNEIYAWGSDIYGQLGLGKTNQDYIDGDNYRYQTLPQKINLENVKTISCSYNHTMALTLTGEVYAWGSNSYGQLGLGHNVDQNSPQIVCIKNVKAIACGNGHTIAITSNGEVYTWGLNSSGQLGIGHKLNQNLPQKLNLEKIIMIGCGHSNTIAISVFTEIYVWGSNNCGELGLGHIENKNLPQRLYI